VEDRGVCFSLHAVSQRFIMRRQHYLSSGSAVGLLRKQHSNRGERARRERFGGRASPRARLLLFLADSLSLEFLWTPGDRDLCGLGHHGAVLAGDRGRHRELLFAHAALGLGGNVRR
jgi:hypothetical protein